MEAVFKDVPGWPEQQQQERDPRFDNQPPIEERVMMEFAEELEREGLTARIQELIESAGRVPETIDDVVAGKIGDLCKQMRDAEKRVGDAREKHNRPILNAQRSLKGKADGILHPMLVAMSNVRTRLDAYMNEQARIRAERQRQADEEARRIREEQARIAREAEEAGRPAPEPLVHVEPANFLKPVARGDLGATVSARTIWKHEIEVPIAKLPKHILEAAPVRDAVDKVIAAAIRAGNREIKGVRIYSEQASSIR